MDLRYVIENKVFTGQLSAIDTNRRQIINTINPHSYCVAKEDAEFAKALLESEYLMPDGTGIVLAKQFLQGRRIRKIAGADIHQYLLEEAERKRLKVFYLGAAPKTLELITERVHKEYPNVQISSYSPPYKPMFTPADSKKMIAEVNAFEPHILFVGMTAPKQEKWVFEHHQQLKANSITSIGAVFDFYAGTVKRSGTVWIKLGLEWLPRLLKEPKRLWRRNFVSTPLFLWYLIQARLK